MSQTDRESACPHCGFPNYWSADAQLTGKTCDMCDTFIRSQDIDKPPPPIDVIVIEPDDVPTAFIARSDYQPEGVPVKIVGPFGLPNE